MRLVSLGKLPPGRHRIRIACLHAQDGWTDVRPTYCDGAPVYRKVPNAWVGVVVSNRLDIEAGETPARRPDGPS